MGQEISKEVHNALEVSIAVLVVISPASIKSQWVPYEIGRDTANDKIILPLLTDPRMELPDYVEREKGIQPHRSFEMDLGAGVAILQYKIGDSVSSSIYFGIDGDTKAHFLRMMGGENSIPFLEFDLLEFTYPEPLGKMGHTYKILNLVYAIYKDIEELKYWITDSIYYAFFTKLCETANLWDYDSYKKIDAPPEDILKSVIKVNDFNERNPTLLDELRKTNPS